MVIKHLTDDEVQQYVVEKQHCEVKVVEHIHFCEVCRAKVEVYQLMIKEIKQQPQPAFDFDLAKMVMQQLPQAKKKISNDKLLVWLFVSIGIIFIGGALYFFQSYFELFEGLKTIFIYLIAITAVTVLVYLFIDMYKKYRHGMKVLDLY
jgi:predicted anti-sigma-YlaC factor YlaD